MRYVDMAECLRACFSQPWPSFMSTSPTRIYLTGFMGSGKSTVGPPLARALSYRFADLDARIEARAGRPVERIFAEAGEAAFRELEAACLRETTEEEHLVIALGGGALAQPRNLRLALQQGCVVYLRVPPALLAQRLQREAAVRPLLLGADGRPLPPDALQARIETMLARREPFYRQAHCIVEVGNQSASEVVEAVLALLQLRSSRKEWRW